MTGPVTDATSEHFTTDATAREKWVVMRHCSR